MNSTVPRLASRRFDALQKTGFFASQGWRQRMRVYSRSLLLEEKPTGWRNVVRGWIRRLKSKSID